MIDLDREMRALLEAEARTAPPLPEAGPTLRRTHRRQAAVVLLGAAVLIVAVIGSLAGISAWIRAAERPIPLEPRPFAPGPLDAVQYGFAWNYQTTVDPGGAVWAVGPGLTRFDPATGEIRAFTLADDPGFQYVSSISPARDGGVWVLSGSPEASIRRFDGAFHEELPAGPVCRVAEGPDGTLWGTGCEDGLFRWDGATWRSVPAEGPVAGPILVDANGGVWVANLEYGERETTGLGLSRFDGRAWATWTIADGLPSDEIETIAEGPAGEMWVGTADGVATYRDGSWVAYPGTEAGVEIVDGIVATEDRVWIAGWSGQVGRVAVFDRTTWTSVTSGAGLGAIGPHPSLAGDAEGTVWLATDESGLYRLDGSRWTLAAAAGLRPDVSRITAVSGDEVWSAGDAYQGWDGLWRLREGVWTEVPGVPGGELNDVAVAPDGGLWVATSTGLARFDGSSWEPVAQDPARAIGLAPDGRVWVSSGRTVGPVGGKALPGPVPLPEPASVVEIGPDGDVWAGCPGFTMATECLQAIAHFDGLRWEVLEPRVLAGDAFLRDLEVTPEGDVWITAVRTTPEGRSTMTTARYRDGTWKESVATDTGVPLDAPFDGYAAAAIETTPDGAVLLLASDGVFTLGQDRWDRLAVGTFGALSVAPDGAVWLGGDGLFRLRAGRP